MCGLAGVIFGNKRRRAEEREYLAWLFTRLLVLSEERGPHATGAAWLDTDGGHRLFNCSAIPGGAPEGTSGSTATTTRSAPGR